VTSSPGSAPPARPLARAESCMRFAVCQTFPELPWLSDRDQVTEADRLRMVGACRACGVVEACATFAITEQITGGFWACEFRDQPDLPKDSMAAESTVEHRAEGQPVAS